MSLVEHAQLGPAYVVPLHMSVKALFSQSTLCGEHRLPSCVQRTCQHCFAGSQKLVKTGKSIRNMESEKFKSLPCLSCYETLEKFPN